MGKKERKKREEAKEKEKERERKEKAARGVGKGYRTVLCGRLHQRERPWERRGVGVDLACVTQTRRPGHLISLFLSSALPILAALEPPIVFKSIHFPISTVAATFFCSLLRSRNSFSLLLNCPCAVSSEIAANGLNYVFLLSDDI